MRLFFILFCLFNSFQAIAAEGIKSPNVSANALFLYQNSNYHNADKDFTTPDQNPNGTRIQEAEIQFYSEVDPYSRLTINLAVHPEYESTGTAIEEKWVLEPEELFFESNHFPSTTLKAGKFKAAMGKQNLLHSHAQPFVQSSLGNEILLGDEGFADVGISAAFLLPTPWFSELTMQLLRGEGENEQFQSPSGSDEVGLANWKNLVDLSDAMTLELGLSHASGANSLRGTTSLNGADLTFKWRPNQGGRYQSVIWSTEYLARTQTQDGVEDESGKGFFSFVQYQFAERWAALYRYDNLKMEQSFDPASLPDGTIERNSVAFLFSPSEFSSFKFEYNERRGGAAGPNGEEKEKTLFVQASFTIGSHPAHSY